MTDKKQLLTNEEELSKVAGGSNQAEMVRVCGGGVVPVYCIPENKPSNMIGYAYSGEQLKFYGFSGDFAKIDYNGRKAYVLKEYVEVL